MSVLVPRTDNPVQGNQLGRANFLLNPGFRSLLSISLAALSLSPAIVQSGLDAVSSTDIVVPKTGFDSPPTRDEESATWSHHTRLPKNDRFL
jgi:hypothetical protein